MNLTEAPLTVRQGVVIVSRALCIYLLLEAMVNLSNFPAHIASLLHLWQESSRLGFAEGSNYITGVYIRDIAVATIRLVAELFFALVFYRCGPKVARFLLPDSSEENTQNAAS